MTIIKCRAIDFHQLITQTKYLAIRHKTSRFTLKPPEKILRRIPSYIYIYIHRSLVCRVAAI